MRSYSFFTAISQSYISQWLAQPQDISGQKKKAMYTWYLTERRKSPHGILAIFSFFKFSSFSLFFGFCFHPPFGGFCLYFECAFFHTIKINFVYLYSNYCIQKRIKIIWSGPGLKRVFYKRKLWIFIHL